MSPVAMWSSEWQRPDAASLTWSSPCRGSSATRSVTSHWPGAERRIAPRVFTGTEDLLVALTAEGRLHAGVHVRDRNVMAWVTHVGRRVQRCRYPAVRGLREGPC